MDEFPFRAQALFFCVRCVQNARIVRACRQAVRLMAQTAQGEAGKDQVMGSQAGRFREDVAVGDGHGVFCVQGFSFQGGNDVCLEIVPVLAVIVLGQTAHIGVAQGRSVAAAIFDEVPSTATGPAQNAQGQFIEAGAEGLGAPRRFRIGCDDFLQWFQIVGKGQVQLVEFKGAAHVGALQAVPKEEAPLFSRKEAFFLVCLFQDPCIGCPIDPFLEKFRVCQNQDRRGKDELDLVFFILFETFGNSIDFSLCFCLCHMRYLLGLKRVFNYLLLPYICIIHLPWLLVNGYSIIYFPKCRKNRNPYPDSGFCFGAVDGT